MSSWGDRELLETENVCPPVEEGPDGAEPCPLQSLIASSPKAGIGEGEEASLTLRFKRALKWRLGAKRDRKLKAMIGSIRELGLRRGRQKELQVPPESKAARRLEAGNLVRVRPRGEIEATLDGWRSLKGCAFLSAMAAYCGTTQRVLKRVERFMDEKDYKMKKADGIVLLENVICPGSGGTGRCDRACFYFWREEWLEKLETPK
jgi:hypothetical protein